MITIIGCALACSVAAAAGENTPFKSKDAGSFSTVPTNSPGVVLSSDVAKGEGTRIGRYSLIAHELINLSNLNITDGAYTMTAADGSTLSGTYKGTGRATDQPGVIAWEVCGPITSGTGRLSGASGSLCFFGSGDLNTGLFSEISVGMLDGVDDSRSQR